MAQALPGDVRFSLAPLGDRTSLETEWCRLEDRADASFFQSWSWIGTWLATLPSAIELLVARFEREGEVIALGICATSRQRRHILWKPRRLLLHQTGRPQLDTIFIEYNGWLADRAHAREIADLAMRCLAKETRLWDEMVLSGVGAPYLDLSAPPGQIRQIEKSLPSFRLDLNGDTSLDPGRFGKNTRHQIRRALRDYSSLGPIGIGAASDAGEAQEFLTELKVLHQSYWQGRGQAGAFAEPYFELFHRRLIQDCWATGRVELLRIRAGTHTVGYLYNFLYRGRVHAYQSGFDYGLVPSSRPGLLCHWLAIERHHASGARIYDFLAGDNRLKRSLSTASVPLHWLVVQRNLVSLRCENLALGVVRGLRRWRPVGRSRPRPEG